MDMHVQGTKEESLMFYTGMERPALGYIQGWQTRETSDNLHITHYIIHYIKQMAAISPCTYQPRRHRAIHRSTRCFVCVSRHLIKLVEPACQWRQQGLKIPKWKAKKKDGKHVSFCHCINAFSVFANIIFPSCAPGLGMIILIIVKTKYFVLSHPLSFLFL
jgi:hypothetical protein